MAKSVHVHLRFGLFADILSELASGAAKMPSPDAARDHLLQAAESFRHALQTRNRRRIAAGKEVSEESMTPEAEVRLLHIME